MKQLLWHTLVVTSVILSIDQVIGSPPNVPTVTDHQALVDSLMSTYTNVAGQAVYPPTSNSYERPLGVIAFDEAAFDDWVTNGWFTLEESGFDFYQLILTETGDTVRAFTIDDGNGLVLYLPATPSGYDPQAWSEAVYGDPPGWLDAAELVIWYADRDPNRQRVTARMLPLAQRAAWLDHLSNTYVTASSGSNAVFSLPIDTNLLAFAATTDSAGTWQPWFYIPGSVSWIDVFGSADLLWPWTLVGSFAPQYTLQSIAAGTSFTNFYLLGSDGSIDSDGDGLSDGREILLFGTDPAVSDSDLDGLDDGTEILNAGLNALLSDTDGDGLTDAFELANNLDGTDATGQDGAQGDPDGDGISNEDEQTLGTDPQVADTIVTLSSSEAGENHKTRTATRSKFTGYPSFVPTNPPAYYLKLVRSSQSHNLTASATTNGCQNQFKADSTYSLTQSVTEVTMKLTGDAYHERIEGYWTNDDWFLTEPTSTQQVTWADSQGTYVTCDLSPTGCWTSTLCGAGYSIGSPPEYHHGKYAPAWLTSKYPGATSTQTTLTTNWNDITGCDESSGSVSWTLSQPYETVILEELTASDLAEMTNSHPWNIIHWSTNVSHTVPDDLCSGPILSTNALTAQMKSSRRFLTTNEVYLDLREDKFRFEVATQSGVVHQISWIELFEPHATTNPGGTNLILHTANVQFLGDGTTQYVGRAEDHGPNPAHPYATLCGDSKDDDFLIPPPAQSLGNGVTKLYVIKVEIKVSSENSPTGSAGKYAMCPSQGSADNLFSVWPEEDFTVHVVVTGASELPENAIVWSVPGENIPANAIEHTFSWTTYGQKLVSLTAFEKPYDVWVDVPNVGNVGQVEAALSLPPWAVAQIGSWAIYSLDYCNANYSVGQERDAMRHSFWTALCVSDGYVTASQVLLFTTAHEYDNKWNDSPRQQAFNSTMDLWNNFAGIGVELSYQTFPPTPDISQILSTLSAHYLQGNLRIFDGNGSESQSEGILLKSDGTKIFPPSQP